jgi:hypothetical protein
VELREDGKNKRYVGPKKGEGEKKIDISRSKRKKGR